jgi:hypothetical protein
MCQYDSFGFMSKKKKTLREKKISDTRHISVSAPLTPQTQTITYSVPTSSLPKQTKASTLETMISLPATIHDLKKSVTISAVIIAVNIVIYFLLANNLIPMRLLGL